MHRNRVTSILVVLIGLLSSTGNAQTETERLAQSTLVFKGTVVRLQASTLSMIPAAANTIVVKVDSVIRIADVTADYTGREVTIRVKDSSQLAVGDRFVFYTKGWFLAEGIGLIEVDRKKVPLAAAANNQLVAQILAASQDADNKLLQARVLSADLIVQGTVVSTEPVELRPLNASPERPREISEHSPRLKKATIEVTSVLSAAAGAAPKVITILYPTSRDVTWLGSPRFERGESGVFVLRNAGKSDELREFLKDVQLPLEDLNKNFVTPNPVDFQPKIDVRAMQQMVNRVRINPPE